MVRLRLSGVEVPEEAPSTTSRVRYNAGRGGFNSAAARKADAQEIADKDCDAPPQLAGTSSVKNNSQISKWCKNLSALPKNSINNPVSRNAFTGKINDTRWDREGEGTYKDAVSGGGGGWVICYLNGPKRFYGFVGGVVDSELFHYHIDLIPSKLCDSIVERII